jgi:hypothetical protein
MDATTKKPKPKRPDRSHLVHDDAVTMASLATHLGLTRQAVAWLTSQGIIERRDDNCFDQSASRLRYIRHLRSEHQRTPRSQADTAFTAAKTEMLQLRLAEKRRELVRQADVDELIDEVMGVLLTALSSMPAQCAPLGDLPTRRRLEAWVFKTRTDLANTAQRKADECNEPALAEQA